MRIVAVAVFALVVFVAQPFAVADSITVTAVGDVNMGTSFPSSAFLPANEGKDLFATVSSLLKGDMVFGNLEGPLLDGGETKKCSSNRNCYAFRTPTRLAPRLKEAGFTVMSLANNHALDFGEAGRDSTMEQLDKLGIAHSGKVGDIANLQVKGKNVALIAFTTADHSHNLLDIPGAKKIVGQLAEKNDIVIVSFHGGTEGSRAIHVPDAPEFLGKEPRGHLMEFAHAVVDAGADLVLGHGPHVLRGMEVYKGRLIAYSLGNFCTYGRFTLSGPLGRAVILKAKIDAESGRFLGAKLYPTIQKRPGGPKPDPNDGGVKDLVKLSSADFPYTAPRITKDGSVTVGASEGFGLLALSSAESRAKVFGLMRDLENKKHSRSSLIKWFGDKRARLIPQVREHFAHPAEKVYSYKDYRKIFMKPALLDKGKAFLKQNAELFSKVETRYSVAPQAVAGIIATETKFGDHPGTFRAFNSLATQALEMGRRRAWAIRELSALLRAFSKDPLAVKGSYAGAVGFVQFMPSNVLRYGQDFDSDGKIDLYSWPDALASCANYLKRHGWKKGGELTRGSANYRAFFKYNPSHHYARIVAELAKAFGYVEQKPANKKKSGGTKRAGAKKSPKNKQKKKPQKNAT